MKEVLVNKINRNRPLGGPRTRWVNVIAQDIENIKKDLTFDDANNK